MHTMHSLHTCCAPFSQRPSLTKHELKDNTVRSFKMAAAGHSTERQACCGPGRRDRPHSPGADRQRRGLQSAFSPVTSPDDRDRCARRCCPPLSYLGEDAVARLRLRHQAREPASERPARRCACVALTTPALANSQSQAATQALRP